VLIARTVCKSEHDERSRSGNGIALEFCILRDGVVSMVVAAMVIAGT